MKLSRSTIIDLPPEMVWAKVQTASLLQHIAWPLVRFVPVGEESLEMFKPGGRYQVKVRLFGFIPFPAQWIVTSVHEPEGNQWPKRLRDNGYSALIKTWDHWIIVEPAPNGATQYADEVEVSAGLMTPFIWAYAKVFYWHRQRRWRGLARTLHARNLIDAEMVAYRATRASGAQDIAWSHLEFAHIISQPHLALHLANHWAMLKFAVAQRNTKEIIGQVVRLALAPLGALTGRIPFGNTGRSNVSAFKPMPIPEELHEHFKGRES